MQYPGRFDISVGESRFSTKWKQENIEWSDFIERLRETHRTAETYKSFIAAKKSRQDEIKDIGGFVGGLIRGGHRLATSVVHRQLVTLDIDFAPVGFWLVFKLMYGNAACIYSTHKHNAAAPRLRLLMPLDRECFPDEYQAICRRIAGNLGIEYFDHTTFQPERLMYWPSTSVDGEYLCESQDGPWLSADETLKSYSDWKDVSQWPVSERFEKIVLKGNEKLGNPLEKPGVIGAFCRCYGMVEGILKFLGDVYEAVDNADDRFTYLGGSTSGGLVVYDDLYAYSHHGTDPASGRGFNIFDLVRIHKFPGVDENVTDKTPINKYPSVQAMMEFAAADPGVRELRGIERLESAGQAFSDYAVSGSGEIVDAVAAGEDGPGVDTEWLKGLSIDKKGSPLSTIENVVLVLENDPYLKGKLAFNAFSTRQIIVGNLPWRRMRTGKYWTDTDDANVRLYFERCYKIVGATKIEDGLKVVFERNVFHPVREYLLGLVWDGRRRVETVLRDFLGAGETGYVRAVSRKFLVGAVARAMNPGIKFDTAIIFIGPQGLGKSTFIEKLAKNKEWYSDSFGSLENNRATEQIQGKWLIEMPELSGMKKTEVSEMKHFMSQNTDTYRPAYAKRVADFPRQCIFIGTTNETDFLSDVTGNRRYWPVNLFGGCPWYSVHVDLDGMVDQIWAEAYVMYAMGEKLHLSRQEEQWAKEIQIEHTEEYQHGPAIIDYLNRLYPENWDEMHLYQRRDFVNRVEDEGSISPVIGTKKQKVCIYEIWMEVFGGQLKDLTRFQSREISTFLKNLPGWILSKNPLFFGVYGRQKGFIRS